MRVLPVFLRKLPYPNLGVYIERVGRETLKLLSMLAKIKVCREGFYLQPKREIVAYLKRSEEELPASIGRLVEKLQVSKV